MTALLIPFHTPDPPILENPSDDQAEAVFLDYFNNYLTVPFFAARRGISEKKARHIIEQGRAANLRLSAKSA